ncbi:hypothetical protein EDB83DRAFT_2312474 [Lactarius deliciosus]|nr:hypothetical protein EDB83DRAFT_2312474 [Lactarius deliciosus]
MPGLVPPLVATVGINGKFSFFEKGSESDYYRGFKNSTGAYELDLGLVHDVSHAWREMRVITDIFCLAAVVLPNNSELVQKGMVNHWQGHLSKSKEVWYNEDKMKRSEQDPCKTYKLEPDCQKT